MSLERPSQICMQYYTRQYNLLPHGFNNVVWLQLVREQATTIKWKKEFYVCIKWIIWICNWACIFKFFFYTFGLALIKNNKSFSLAFMIFFFLFLLFGSTRWNIHESEREREKSVLKQTIKLRGGRAWWRGMRVIAGSKNIYKLGHRFSIIIQFTALEVKSFRSNKQS